MTEQPETTAAAPNIEGMGIHISYIRRDLESMNKKLDTLINTFVSSAEFADHLKADEDHENRIRILESFASTLTGKMLGAAAVLGAAFGIATIIISNYWKLS